MQTKTLPQRLRAALGVLFDSTNPWEKWRRPLEIRSVGGIADEVNSTNRLDLVSDSRKLYANLGPAKGAIDAKAMYSVGRSWLPRFEGTDKAWGEEARQWLLEKWYPVADVAGRDFQTSLYLCSVSIDRDGDVGAGLIKYDTGFPAIQLIASHEIGFRNESKDLDKGKIKTGPYAGLTGYAGVAVNAQGRAVGYHHLGDTAEDDQWVSARDMALLLDPSWVDQVRGLPGFAHAILDLKDLRTVQGYEKMASALASSIGLLEYNETGLADASDPALVLSGGRMASGDIVTRDYLGGTVRHFKAGAGGKLEAIKSDRPGDAWDKFMNRLIRNAAAGINWPYELMWDISALGGANTRFIISTAMRSVEDRQDLLRPFAKRAVGFACLNAIQTKELRNSEDWWRWGFTMPARMTADFGRDANAQREDYHAGIINMADICAEDGKDLDVHIAQRKEENAKLINSGVVGASFFEALGQAVRAAAVTPSREVEELTRKAIGLPVMGQAVEENWAEVGTVNPVTILPGADNTDAGSADAKKAEDDKTSELSAKIDALSAKLDPHPVTLADARGQLSLMLENDRTLTALYDDMKNRRAQFTPGKS